METKFDNAVRVKVTNGCQWTCTFCHNEGTELPISGNAANRVSVFLDPQAKVLPQVENITVEDDSLQWIDSIRGLGVDEVHLTGGEPTLHPKLPTLIRVLRSKDFKVKMTSNGQASPAQIKEIVDAGLSSITFSILSLDPVEFLKTQNPPRLPGLDPIKWAARMIDREKSNVLLAKELGVEVKINTAVLGEEDYGRVDTVREFAQENGIGLVLLPSVGDQEHTQEAVFNYAQSHGQLVRVSENANNSNSSRVYLMPDNSELRAKYLREYHPEVVCGGCEHNGKPTCLERFYGIRMEFRAGDPYVRLCVQKTNDKTVMPLTQFIDQGIYSKLIV